MINLLPYEEKRQIRAGQTNTILLRYIIMLVVALLFLTGVFGMYYRSLTQIQTDAQQLIDTNQQKASAYNTARQQATALTASLSSAQTVLSQQVCYSNILTAIGAATPSGVILTALALSPTTLGTPTTITAYATSSATALALQTAYKNATALFTGVTLSQLSTAGSSVSGYPVTITLNLTINKAAGNCS